MSEKISKLVNVYKKYGFLGFLKKLYAYIKANYMDRISFKTLLFYSKYKKEIKSILSSEKYDRIILWRSSFGYNVPLFQRPQHIANNLAKEKCFVFKAFFDKSYKNFSAEIRQNSAQNARFFDKC